MRRVFILLAALAAVCICGCAEAETGTDSASPPPVADRPDTGRMSGSEHDGFVTAHANFADEADAFTGEIGKCATIATAGQLAEASQCFDDAYDGVWDAASWAFTETEDLIPATAKRCRRALVASKRQTNRIAQRLDRLHEMTSGLEIDPASAQAAMRGIENGTIDYAAAYAMASDRCEPR